MTRNTAPKPTPPPNGPGPVVLDPSQLDQVTVNRRA